LTFGSRTTKNRQRCIFPPLGAHTPAARILRISSFGTGSAFSRRIDRVVRMISNRSAMRLFPPEATEVTKGTGHASRNKFDAECDQANQH
jgi:hypothetical protein